MLKMEKNGNYNIASFLMKYKSVKVSPTLSDIAPVWNYLQRTFS